MMATNESLADDSGGQARRKAVMAVLAHSATANIAARLGALALPVHEDLRQPENGLVMPGLIELHTDHLEMHYVPRPKVFWDPIAAVVSYDGQLATSGITTVLDSLRVWREDGAEEVDGRAGVLAEAITTARDANLLRADHFLHLRCEIPMPSVVEEARELVDRPDVRLMSLMDHTPGQRQFRDEVKLREYYRGKGGGMPNCITIITPIEPASTERCRTYLRKNAEPRIGMQCTPQFGFDRIPSLHFASFVILDETADFGPSLVFEATFDGPKADFVSDLLQVAGNGMTSARSISPISIRESARKVRSSTLG